MPGPLASVLLSALLSGQAQPPPEPIQWDVISVKPAPAESCKAGDGRIRYLPNGLSASCIPATFLVEFAFHLMDPARILGLPKWAAGPQLYTIDARVSAQDSKAFDALKHDQKSSTMQSILAERFALKAHRETRDLHAYSLVVAKSGSRLKAPADAATPGQSQFGNTDGDVTWVNSPLTNLIFLLATETGRPVIDSTGLTGKYDFHLLFTPSATESSDDASRPSIFTALQEQLGLKLVPAKAPVEVLVVDTIKEPTAN